MDSINRELSNKFQMSNIDKHALLRHNRTKGRTKKSVHQHPSRKPELKDDTMSEKPEELKKLASIAADMTLPADLRNKAVEQLGNMASHEALLALLELAANEGLVTKERDLALKHAREIIKKTGP